MEVISRDLHDYLKKVTPTYYHYLTIITESSKVMKCMEQQTLGATGFGIHRCGG